MPLTPSIDWPAWVQAVGSVAAIAAAIWIDQGAARRLRAERSDLAKQAIATRLSLIDEASESVRAAIARVREADMTMDPSIPSPERRRMEAARGALDYFLATPSEVDPKLVGRLLLAREYINLALQRSGEILANSKETRHLVIVVLSEQLEALDRLAADHRALQSAPQRNPRH